MKATIAVLAGDGIGPEVTAQAVKVLLAVAERYGHEVTLKDGLFGGCAIDRCGDAFPEETRALCEDADAVFLGAVGGPKWDSGATDRPERGLLALRKMLGLYANIRPVKIYPSLMSQSSLKAEVLQGVDLVVVRELTGGIYFGKKERWADGAMDTCVYSVEEVTRIAEVACQLALKRLGRLISVDKANILETSRLWRDVVSDHVARNHPQVELEHMLVDAAAMHLIRQPARFDVIVTSNMFGDILTDEASMLSGSMGLLPSASLGDGAKGLYEPIHGSAPDIAGMEVANPLAAIASIAMMLRMTFGLIEESDVVEAAIDDVINSGTLTPDLGGTATTEQVGDAVCTSVMLASSRHSKLPI